MDIRTILNPGDVGGYPVQTSNSSVALRCDPNTQNTRGCTIDKRHLRSSTHTFIAPEASKPQVYRVVRCSSECPRPVPLSSEYAAIHNHSHHRSLPPTPHMSTLQEIPKASPKPVFRRSPQEPSSPSSAQRLLSRARQSVDLVANPLARKPSVMDVILDMKSPVRVECEEDVLTDVTKRSQGSFEPSYREYDFASEQSLNTYWIDQTSVWDGVRAPWDIVTRFPDSSERSTMSWVPTLNGETEPGYACDYLSPEGVL